MKNKILSIIRLFLNKPVSGLYAKYRRKDIFLVSYPKSGNTWLRFLLGNLLYGKVDFTTINELVPDIYISSNKQIEEFEKNRIFKSHERFTSKYSKVVYLHRDPRDVVISYYYWYLKFLKRDIRFDDFFDDFIKGKVKFGSWDKHYHSWINAAKSNPNNILIINYKDLKNDTQMTFKEILKFCNIGADDSAISEAVRKSSFNEMKNLENSQVEESFLSRTDSKINFVRSGKSEWRDRLTDAQKEIIYNRFKLKEIELYNYK